MRLAVGGLLLGVGALAGRETKGADFTDEPVTAAEPLPPVAT